ncbi:oligosaccharide flippase family protein [Rubrivirga sp. S365]|uniref:Oligosaccharide flippase family protein n=1 Tax=Rubrivirga litoralis TaxID=3075598 RepID=A0ABU3BV53_9BACT|nr:MULTISPECIES: oligosaccharide flippase family protein [unclassified Rubrivirga]MDT0633174.1 oligosaccharide flippase family protein [Rubrivirga sp. F394]MDT7858011.1 oligosaccharide flippase family protein [Rubrivirga sp. S365]
MSVPRNTAYNAVGSAVPLAVMVLAVPPYLAAIGEARYGVLAVLWTLLGYFGLFDLGLGRAVTNRVAALHGASAERREAVFWTALLLNLALGLGAGLALWAAATLVFGLVVDVPSALAGEVKAALPFLALAFPLLLASSVMAGALMGREEFLRQNVVRVGEGALVQLVPLAVALTAGPQLSGLVLAVLAVRTASSLALFALCVRRLPVGLHPRLDRREVRPLFVYGGWVTVTSAINPLLSTLDRVVIGAVSGVRAVSYYTVPFGVVTQITLVPGSLTNALFPRFSARAALGEQHALQAKGMRSVAAVVTPAVVASLLLVDPLIAWWISPAFAEAAGLVGILLLPGVWFNCLAYVPFAMLQGSGRPDLVAKVHAAELVPYLLLLWLALHEYGAAGAAAAWSARAIVDTVVLSVLSRVPARTIRSVFGAGALVAAALAVAVLGLGFTPSLVLGATLFAVAGWTGYVQLRPLIKPLTGAA